MVLHGAPPPFGQAVYHAKLAWTWESKKQNRRAADAFMSTNCRLVLANNSETVLREVLDFRRSVENTLQLDAESVVLLRSMPANLPGAPCSVCSMMHPWCFSA